MSPTPEVAERSAAVGVLRPMQSDRASTLILMTLAVATLSTVLFLINVAAVPGEALFAVVVTVAAMRPALRRADMSLTAPIATVPRAHHVQPRR